MKRMKHKDHGYHDALTITEEEFLKANGWIEDDGKELAAKLSRIKQNEQAEVVEFKEVKRGRPFKEA